MARAFVPKVVTANDLLEGDVIYLTADNQWSRHLHEAYVVTDTDQADQRLADSQRHANAVGIYLADVTLTGPEPVHFREDFRRRGPSNYHHGKQAAS
jgi:hypothetical protein